MFGLVDCNNFYVSCERVFQPRLEGRPVVILSNNDGCIISRSAEAKALGLKMGDPYFQVKEQLRQDSVQVFSSNYTLYGDMSRRVMHYLGATVLAVEIYSIDEAFLDLGGLEQHLTPYLGNLTDLAQRLRVGVKARTGIPVCVGVAPTKTLAKLANRLAKKDAGLGGVLYLDSAQRRAWALGQVPVGDVWGVGRQYAQKLTAAGIDSAADLSRVSEAWARKFLGGVVGARLVRELQGYPCAGLAPSEDGTLRRQSISCSRTFGRPLRERASVLGAVSAFVARAAEKLRRQGDLAHVLTVFVSKNRFGPAADAGGGHSRSAVLTLPVPTSDTRELTARAAQLLARLWEPGAVYVKAGVVMAGLEAPGGQQLGLFGGGRAAGGGCRSRWPERADDGGAGWAECAVRARDGAAGGGAGAEGRRAGALAGAGGVAHTGLYDAAGGPDDGQLVFSGWLKAGPFLHPFSFIEMPHFVPDAESITEFYGAYEQQGCKFEVVSAPEMGGYGLRMRLGGGGNVWPIFPLPQSEMDSVEAAERWLAHLRDNELSLFFSLRKAG